MTAVTFLLRKEFYAQRIALEKMLQNLSNFYGIRWFDFYSALLSNFSAIRKLSFVKKWKKKKKGVRFGTCNSKTMANFDEFIEY